MVVLRLENSWQRKPLKREKAKNEARLSTEDATFIDFLEELVEIFGIEIRYKVVKQDEDEAFVIGGL